MNPIRRVRVLPVVALSLFAGLAAPVWGWGQPGGNPGAGKATNIDPEGKPGTYAVIDGKKAEIPKIAMGDPAMVAKIIAEGKKNNHVWDQISHISNEIGHRLTGSSNVEKANLWARDQFEKWGLAIPEFGSAAGVTPPAVPSHDLRGLWQWDTVSLRFDRGPSTGRVVSLRPGSDEYRTIRDMEFTTLSWTPGTKGAVRGIVVKMPENDEQLAASKDKIKGAWILVKPNQGRRGVMGGASARVQLFSDIRKRWKEPATPTPAPADPPTRTPDAAAAAPAEDKNRAYYEGTINGGPEFLDGQPFTLDLDLADPKAVKGKLNLGGFFDADLKNATYNETSHELKFSTDSPRGERNYVLQLDGETVRGETSLPDNGGKVTYIGKKAKAPVKAAGEGSKQAPTLEEKVLALEPAGWILASSNELVITAGAPGWSKLDLDKLNPDVIVTVRKSDYDCMNSMIADGQTPEAEFNLQHGFTKGPIPVYNTIAEIRGTEKPDEVVIVSGHLDSWDGPGSKGTVDNGTGSAVTIEAARILAAVKAKPKRTIRFVLWTGEEQGLLGSTAYVKVLKEKGELAKISAVLVDDGGTNYEGGLPCVASEVDYLAAATAAVNGQFYSEADKAFMNVNIHAGKVFSQVQGSDHNSFMREKVPGFFWDEVGRSDYNHMHHTQHDHLENAIREYLEQSATCAAVTAYNLACAPDLLPRPTDEEWPSRGGGGGRGGAGGGAGGGGGRRGAGNGGASGAGAGGTPASTPETPASAPK